MGFAARQPGVTFTKAVAPNKLTLSLSAIMFPGVSDGNMSPVLCPGPCPLSSTPGNAQGNWKQGHPHYPPPTLFQVHSSGWLCLTCTSYRNNCDGLRGTVAQVLQPALDVSPELVQWQGWVSALSSPEQISCVLRGMFAGGHPRPRQVPQDNGYIISHLAKPCKYREAPSTVWTWNIPERHS